MENSANEKVTKVAPKPSKYATLRVRKETRRRVLQEVTRCNKKDFGGKVKADDVVARAMSKFTAEDVKDLQEGSLSNIDLLDREHREYVAKNGPISRNDFIGKILSGEVRVALPGTKIGSGSQAT